MANYFRHGCRDSPGQELLRAKTIVSASKRAGKMGLSDLFKLL